MAVLNWGDLTKNQEDPETIEEAIARIVAEHNDDEEAHLDTGQSLQSHKASEIIDHLAESIVADKLLRGAVSLTKFSYDDYTGLINFESVDAWSISADSQNVSFGRLSISSSAVLSNVARARLNGGFPGGFVREDKNWFLKFGYQLQNENNMDAWWGAGTIYEPWDVWENVAACFRVISGQLAAVWVEYDSVGDEYNESHQNISGYDPSDFHFYEIRYNASTNTLTFYIDNTFVHTEVVDFGGVYDEDVISIVGKNTDTYVVPQYLYSVFFACRDEELF